MEKIFKEQTIINVEKLHRKILRKTKNRFDLRNLLQSLPLEPLASTLEATWRDVIGDSNSGVISLLNDPERKLAIEIYRLMITAKNTDGIVAFGTDKKPSGDVPIDPVIELLSREILYIGSECERQGLIGIEEEFAAIKKNLTSIFIKLEKVDEPVTVENIYKKWDTMRPNVVFFSCHGDTLGLYLGDDKNNCTHYNNTNFRNFFKERINFTECVVLSACESLDLGRSIVEHARNVICVNKKVDIPTATKFNELFFAYLDRHSLENVAVYEDAFKQSVKTINFSGLKDGFAFEFLKSDIIK